MNAPEVSVVVVSHGTRDLTLAALASLRGGAGGLAVEAIIVDNASADGTAEAVEREHPGAALLRAPSNRGFAAGANLGARAARGEWLLFLNPDARLTPGALPALLRAARALPRPGAIGPRLVGERGKRERSAGHFYGPWRDFVQAFHLYRLFPSSRAFEGIQMRRLPRAPESVDWVSGACLLVRRDAFEEAGGFDEAYFLYVEDMDLCYRLRRSGRDNLYVPDAVVEHLIGRSPREGKGILLEGGNAPEYFVRKFGIRYPRPLQRLLRAFTLAGWFPILGARALAELLRGRDPAGTLRTARLCGRSLGALLGLAKGDAPAPGARTTGAPEADARASGTRAADARATGAGRAGAR